MKEKALFITPTTYNDVIKTFAERSENAKKRINTSLNNKRYEISSNLIKSHIVNKLYQLTPDQIENVCRTTEHALGNIKKETVNPVISIRDWSSPLTFVQIFQYLIEKENRMITYQELLPLCLSDKFLTTSFIEPAKLAINEAIKDGFSKQTAKDAMHWRVGLAYYSVLKEVYVLTQLRELGINLLYHPLADITLKVDFWCNNTLMSLFMTNGFFKSKDSGRKEITSDIFKDADPPFKFYDMVLNPAERYGVVNLPTKKQIEEAANKLLDFDSK